MAQTTKDVAERIRLLKMLTADPECDSATATIAKVLLLYSKGAGSVTQGASNVT